MILHANDVLYAIELVFHTLELIQRLPVHPPQGTMLILGRLEALPFFMSLYHVGGDIHCNKVFEKGLVPSSKTGQVLCESCAFRSRIYDMRYLSNVNKASSCLCPLLLNTYRITQQVLGTAVRIIHQIIDMSRAILRHVVAYR